MTIHTRITSDQVKAQLAIAAVALEFGTPLIDIVSSAKGPAEVSFARQVAIYLMHVVFETNISRTARAFNRDRSTASHACRVIEDCRDDPVFDRKISQLENFLQNAPIPDLDSKRSSR